MDSAFSKIEKLKQYLDEGFNPLDFVKYLEVLDELKEVQSSLVAPNHKSSVSSSLDNLEKYITEDMPEMIPFELKVIESSLKASAALKKWKGGKGKRRTNKKKRTTKKKRSAKNKKHKSKSAGKKKRSRH